MQEIQGWHGGHIKAWVDGVEFEQSAQEQAHNAASLPFIFKHVAIMSDVHAGYGSTVGSVIPTKAAIVPSFVGVDIGCGVIAIRTTLTAFDLPDTLAPLRSAIERSVPHGGMGPKAGWAGSAGGIPNSITNRWVNSGLEARFKGLVERYPDFDNGNSLIHLGSLGSGNHFIEVCLDEAQRVWVMLHSGSRGIGNLIGRTFTEMAREVLLTRDVHLPDKDLAWFDEGTDLFRDYIDAMTWAQDFAMQNREAMMERVLRVMRESLPPFQTDKVAINAHHNYASKEHHFGEDIWVTRKGAVSAQRDQLGIVPGSMGARSYITRGLGNVDAFCSCPHGAGRRMSRGEAKRTFTVEDHIAATAGVECRKDIGVIDETPGCYKDIDAVMVAASSLVSIEHTLKQIVCVKG